MNPKPSIRFVRLPALTGSWEKPIIKWIGFSRLESYLQFPLPQITTFLLLVHMAFGCCVHHAHACETNCCSEPAATAEACPCGTHRHDDQTESGTSEPSERGGHSDRHHCTGDHCTFLEHQRSPEQLGEFFADSCTLDTVATDGQVESFRSQLDRSLDQHVFVAGSSLRTHLALRVLLI